MDKPLFIAYDKYTRRIPAEELSTLLKVSSSLASTMDLEQVLQIAIESTTALLDLDTGAIYTLENETLILGATTPALPPDFPVDLRRTPLRDHPHIRKALENKTPVGVEDTHTAKLSPAEKQVVEARKLVSILYFPLLLKEEAIGVFIVGTNEKRRDFSGSEIDLCYILSNQVALAISNARLYRKSQQSAQELSLAYDATLEGWSRMLEIRDHATETHTRRVAEMTVALARRMGIPEKELEHVRRGALLHDIGKMAVPDSILHKPEALNDEEQRIMQTHPEKAQQVLSKIPYLLPDLDIPYSHHEDWDGTGYPRGLKGEEIPLAARIFSVVDVYDALTSGRPYRKAWSKKDAMKYLEEKSGKIFYPAAVKAFLEMIKD